MGFDVVEPDGTIEKISEFEERSRLGGADPVRPWSPLGPIGPSEPVTIFPFMAPLKKTSPMKTIVPLTLLPDALDMEPDVPDTTRNTSSPIVEGINPPLAGDLMPPVKSLATEAL